MSCHANNVAVATSAAMPGMSTIVVQGLRPKATTLYEPVQYSPEYDSVLVSVLV